jgi:hypothetical protein
MTAALIQKALPARRRGCLKTQFRAGFQPFFCCDFFPGALPQAGIDRTFGALKRGFKAVKAPKAHTIPAWGEALGLMPKKDQGLKARSIKSFETASPALPVANRWTDSSGWATGILQYLITVLSQNR